MFLDKEVAVEISKLAKKAIRSQKWELRIGFWKAFFRRYWSSPKGFSAMNPPQGFFAIILVILTLLGFLGACLHLEDHPDASALMTFSVAIGAQTILFALNYFVPDLFVAFREERDIQRRNGPRKVDRDDAIIHFFMKKLIRAIDGLIGSKSDFYKKKRQIEALLEKARIAEQRITLLCKADIVPEFILTAQELIDDDIKALETARAELETFESKIRSYELECRDHIRALNTPLQRLSLVEEINTIHTEVAQSVEESQKVIEQATVQLEAEIVQIKGQLHEKFGDVGVLLAIESPEGTAQKRRTIKVMESSVKYCRKLAEGQ